MTVAIYASAGTYYTNADSVAAVRGALDRGELIRCFWYAGWGQRYTEDVWFQLDDIKMVRTESEDG